MTSTHIASAGQAWRQRSFATVLRILFCSLDGCLTSALERALGLGQSKNHCGAEKRCDSRGYKAAHSHEEPYVISGAATGEREKHDGTENSNWQGDQKSGGYPVP